jgi:molybdenum cofactor cytidylyltransferase
MSAEALRGAQTRGGPVAGVLLAAGTSSRMGTNKLLLEIEGETLLRRSARMALAAGLSPLVVVLGHEAERTTLEVAGLDCETTVNGDYEAGIVTSLRAGLAALPPAVSAAVVMLADMPFVTAGMVAALVTRYQQTTAPLVISDYEGVLAPPMLYDRALFPALLAMDDGRCGRQVVQRHRAEAEVLAWPAAALADVDVPADVERLLLGAGAGQ